MGKINSRHADVLRQYMEATGASVIEISKRTGLTRAFIYMILNGQCNVGFKSALRFKEALGVDLDKWL